ncbi:MAG: hypothetical protein RLZZ338_3979, partial [Cyanobacteriota bacterium]
LPPQPRACRQKRVGTGALPLQISMNDLDLLYDEAEKANLTQLLR